MNVSEYAYVWLCVVRLLIANTGCDSIVLLQVEGAQEKRSKQPGNICSVA